MRIKYICVLFLFIIIPASFCLAVTPPDRSNYESENGPSNYPDSRRTNRTQTTYHQNYDDSANIIHAFGPIISIGTSRSVGSVNYEGLLNGNILDVYHNDGRKHLLNCGIGAKYAFLITKFLPVGFTMVVSYQRFGLVVENSTYSINGAIQSGNKHDLKLDYLYFNPAFNIGFFKSGVYFAYIASAKLDNIDVSDKFAKFDFGFTVGLDMIVPLNNSPFVISIVVEGIFGVVNIYKNFYSRAYRNIAFNFALSIMANFARK